MNEVVTSAATAPCVSSQQFDLFVMFCFAAFAAICLCAAVEALIRLAREQRCISYGKQLLEAVANDSESADTVIESVHQQNCAFFQAIVAPAKVTDFGLRLARFNEDTQ